MIALVGFYWLPESPRWLLEVNREADAIQVRLVFFLTPPSILFNTLKKKDRRRVGNSSYLLMHHVNTFETLLPFWVLKKQPTTIHNFVTH